MEERSAGQWIQLLERLWLFGGLEAIDRRQQELVRARRELLQGRERVGAVAQSLRLEHRLRVAVDAGDAVERCPLRAGPSPPGGHRALEILIQLEQIVRVPPHL